MPKPYSTAREAIIASQRTGEMTRCEESPLNRQLLDIEADGSNSLGEYWLADRNVATRYLWRVALVN